MTVNHTVKTKTNECNPILTSRYVKWHLVSAGRVGYYSCIIKCKVWPHSIMIKVFFLLSCLMLSYGNPKKLLIRLNVKYSSKNLRLNKNEVSSNYEWEQGAKFLNPYDNHNFKLFPKSHEQSLGKDYSGIPRFLIHLFRSKTIISERHSRHWIQQFFWNLYLRWWNCKL